MVTTVYYQKPKEDDGKELVLFKPALNFKPSYDSLYTAARGIQTNHGMIHVQRAGLQSQAMHGIFHAPNFENRDNEPISESRKGYRVAISGRINYPDSDKVLKPYEENEHYSVVLGPQGNKTLCLDDDNNDEE